MTRKARPKGGMISVSPEERSRFKDRREALDLTQRDLAKKVGVSAPTISNLESGRHPQIARVVYVKLKRVLLGEAEPTAEHEAIHEFIVENTIGLDMADLYAVKGLVEALKKRKEQS